ncbi:TetR family transcriptional regulator [Amycolatopsis mediterranei S699]|uniref:TetR family transcriptional regulator n=2 Tax=Amycolatopsis mediterranei TaxID=33910 RepID=A0A0H3DAX9_AMYMU|nr:TetR/AcrR family transcriptional regulator [Amycolatopsis mediterranei]ADJ46704.1 TetR family transcriptional regulator [Amycolatopsis mediterranei U32]AEK43506.1 TetR family transcriptional regulator [Amycolatopsis mediterranei S699]AFO78415.1 TetR family transcriptional regulator [Amycolatopsis mediterranei S699]AGT85543.1 TetR family transcriptional regulator [Amycolatopsis mediterranei RB]KDO11394.1 transcriptional regulator [Amycolatopsis mediterranei]
MARPREFDETAAVEKAMHAFWEHGYEATTTQDLCEATGLGRSSVYNTFTSKRALFRRSLAHYTDTQLDKRQALLDGPGTAAERIAAVLDSAIEADLEDRRRGCFVVNTLAELGLPDDEVGAALRGDTDRNLTMFAECVREGVLDGSLRDGLDPAEVAEFLLSTTSGLRVMARRGTSPDSMHAVADIALSAILAR